MSKRQRQKQDGNYTGPPKTDHQLGSAKKLRVSSRSRLRSSRQETCTNNDVTSSYTSPGYGSNLLTGHSPICSTPRSSRKRSNTSRSDSETEIIWDANSPTAHLVRRNGRNGRSKAGEISEMIKCVNNQAETSPAHFPLLGLWTHRSPLHQLHSAGGSQKALGEESSTSKKPTHKKKKASRLSLIQDELQKIANALDMASKHEPALTPNTVLNQEPAPTPNTVLNQEPAPTPNTVLNQELATGFITPPRNNRTKGLTDTVDGEFHRDTSFTNARQEPDEKLTPGTRPPCLQTNPNRLVGNQVNIQQFASDQLPTGQPAADQTDSVQPLVPSRVGTCSPVIGQSLTSNVDIMWDDDSYFEDEALLQQLTQTEAMEASRSQNGDISKKKASHNPPAHSAISLRQPLNLGVTNKMWVERDNNNGQKKSQTFPGTFPRPTISNRSTAANQIHVQHCTKSRFNARNVVKDTCSNQEKKQVPLEKPVAVKRPPPAQVTQVSNCTIVQSEQYQAPPSYKTHVSLPAHLDGCSAKSNLAKPYTSSCIQLKPTANAAGKSSNSLKPCNATCNPISNKLQLTESSSINSSSSIQEGWDNMDLFESSLTDEMMMSLCVGIDSPQTTQASEQITQVQDSKPFISTRTNTNQSAQDSKPFMSTRTNTTQSAQDSKPFTSTRTNTNQSAQDSKPFMSTRTNTTQSVDKAIKTQSSSKITTNSCIGSSSTTTYKFRKPVKDISKAVSHCTSTAPVGKCSTSTLFINQPFQSTINTVLPVHVKNIQPVNNTIRHQTTHPHPQSNGSGVPSLNTTQPAVPSSVYNATGPSSTNDNLASSYSKPVNANSTSYKTLTAQSMRSFQTKTTLSASTKPAVLSTSTGGSHKVCSQTEIERKRQQAMARLQQHKAGSQQRMMQQR